MKTLLRTALATVFTLIATIAFADPGAYLEITIEVDKSNRAAAAAVYTQYKQPFLDTVPGAQQKVLLVRDEDVQVLHGFETVAQAKAYLSSELFSNDVVAGLKPYLASAPKVRIYSAH